MKNKIRFSKNKSIILIIIIMLLGASLLVLTHAQTISLSIEPENGVRSGNQNLVTDSSASNTKYIKFGNNGLVPSGKFYIVGSQIVDPNGKIFQPIGVNAAINPGYVFNWNGTANGHVAEFKAWGWNTLRINLTCGNANGTNDINSLYTGIDNIIQEYTSQNVVVMIECHDFTGSSPTDVSSLYPFWDTIVSKYTGNPYVWFNILNEPYSGSATTDISNWMTVQTTLLNRIRAKAPYNIFVADIPRYGQGVETLQGTNSITRLGNGKCNVLYSWHDYGAVSTDYNTNNTESTNTSAQIATFDYFKANNIPVVIGEFGDPLTLNEGSAGPPQWNRWGAYAAMNNAPARGIGIVWWHATGDSGIFETYSLMADRHVAPWSAANSGAGTSDAGLRFWQVSRSQPVLATFSGNLSQSNCN